MFKQVKHVIWDWNGTMINDPSLCHAILIKMLDKRRLPQVDFETYRDHFNFPLVEYYESIGFNFSEEDFRDVAIEFIDQYEAEKHRCELHQDCLELLMALDKLSYEQHLFSAYKDHLLKDFLKHLNLTRFFKTVQGVDNLHALGKQDEIAAFMKNQGLQAQDLLMIGDTLHDLEISQALGIPCLLLSHGHHSHKRLKEKHEHVHQNFTEILELLS